MNEASEKIAVIAMIELTTATIEVIVNTGSTIGIVTTENTIGTATNAVSGMTGVSETTAAITGTIGEKITMELQGSF
jgi:hypothetical protein